MRLYNPNYKKHAKRDKLLTIIASCWSVLVAVAAIGFLVYLIINKWAWYFYFADGIGGLILAGLLWWIFPTAEREYIDFEDFDTQKKTTTAKISRQQGHCSGNARHCERTYFGLLCPTRVVWRNCRVRLRRSVRSERHNF